MTLRPSPLPGSTVATYEEYVAARWTALYRTAYLLTANHADAEDLAQAALVKAYLSWSKVVSAASPDAYVRRILTNVFLSERRRLRHSRERIVEQTPDLGVPGPTGEDRLVLWPQIAALSPRQRAVVVLRYYEDLTEQQIADTLGCSPGTVKSTASDALKALRTRVDTEGALS